MDVSLLAFFSELALFALKTFLILAAILVLVVLIFQVSGRGRSHQEIEIEKLNSRFRAFRRHLQSHLLAKRAFKTLLKDEKKLAKKDGESKASRIFVLDFHGDIRASDVASLREETTAILSIAKAGDEVVVRLESGGGLVTAYGLAAAQLIRFKEHGVKLTVSVDKIAASGGYMMACVADKILAGPFAVVGSIGVVAQVPNFHKLLERNHIEYREVTAGEFKRTVSVFGEITEAGMRKFKEQIEDTHALFKEFVSTHRPKVNIDHVATGEYWYGRRALENGLVDELITSDEYIFKAFEVADVYRIQYHIRKKWMDRLSDSAAKSLQTAFFKLWGDLDQTRFGS